MPKFSIIIPVYNVAPYLHECLDSVLAQTFTDWEAICVDDGSTDASLEILETYSKKDSRVKLHRQTNKGVGLARNKGIAHAGGEFVWFIDGDDIIHPQSLEHINEVLEQGHDAYTFPCCICDVSVPDWNPLAKDIGGLFRGRCYETYRGFRMGACFVCFRRSKLGEIRFSQLTVGEDVLFFTELYSTTSQIVTDAASIYFYRIRTSGVSHGTVKLASVADNLIAETRALEVIQEMVWADRDLRLLFTKHQMFWMLGNQNKFLRLANCDRKRLLPLWLALQSTVVKTFRRGILLRIAIFILRIFPSGLLCKYIIYGIWRINRLRRTFIRG